MSEVSRVSSGGLVNNTVLALQLSCIGHHMYPCLIGSDSGCSVPLHADRQKKMETQRRKRDCKITGDLN